VKPRIEKIRQILAKEKLAAFVVFNHEDDNKNLFYLTHFSGSSGVLVVTKKQAFLFVDGRYKERARQEALHSRIVNTLRRESSGEVIARALRLGKVRKGARVGYEGKRVSVLLEREWRKYVPAKMIPTDFLVERMRQCKDKREIAALSHACKVTSAIFTEISKRIHAGMRECDIAAEIDHRLRKAGATAPSFPTIVAGGQNSALPHHKTGNRRVRAGEPVVIDFGGVFESSYCSDLTRTIFVPGKKPSKKLMEIYDIVLAANKKAFRDVKPGMSWKNYDAIARDYIAKSGYGKEFLHGLGHSLGLEAHDPYNYKNDPITTGTVFTNEPGVYLLGLGGVRIEDDLVMTKSGPKRLTNTPQ